MLLTAATLQVVAASVTIFIVALRSTKANMRAGDTSTRRNSLPLRCANVMSSSHASLQLLREDDSSCRSYLPVHCAGDICSHRDSSSSCASDQTSDISNHDVTEQTTASRLDLPEESADSEHAAGGTVATTSARRTLEYLEHEPR